MRLKIRCDRECGKFCKIFWEVNKASAKPADSGGTIGQLQLAHRCHATVKIASQRRLFTRGTKCGLLKKITERYGYGIFIHRA